MNEKTPKKISLRDSTIKVVNPATGIKIVRLKKHTKAEIEEKFETLKNGQKAWAAKAFAERWECMQSFFRLLDVEKIDLAETLSSEIGKPYSQALDEIQGARGRIHFFLNNTKNWLQTETMIPHYPTQERLEFEPLGVVAYLSHWSNPYLAAATYIVPALLTGNTVMYQPAENSLLTARHIRNLLADAGVPKSVFQDVICTEKEQEILLDLPFDAYFFVGTSERGKYIAQRVAPKFVPLHLSLNGKDAVYIADDVDIKRAAQVVAEGAFYNTGQHFSSVERIYVHENIYESFVDLLVHEVREHWQIGLPAKRYTKVGAVSKKEHLAFLSKQVADAVEKGAKVCLGGQKAARKGWFFEPTILSNTNETMAIMSEPSLGPIVGVQKVADDDEALKQMNNSKFGLTAAVFSEDEYRALYLLERLKVGTTYWNCCDRISANLPFAGRQQSGLGASLSYMGIRSFVQPKAFHLRQFL